MVLAGAVEGWGSPESFPREARGSARQDAGEGRCGGPGSWASAQPWSCSVGLCVRSEKLGPSCSSVSPNVRIIISLSFPAILMDENFMAEFFLLNFLVSFEHGSSLLFF